ncbi:MAG: ATP-binding domain-containing protein [Rhodobacteraceae bacterium]|nr:ATP-binding domain-containing protein [Paracoccaceae bacterium]
MAKRKFELPGIQDLSKEQEAARALPKEGQHLIIGGPGTGKSVLALIRSKRLQREGDDYLFLVYNHLLNNASKQLFGGGFVSKTWTSWFWKAFREHTGRAVPRLPPNSNGYMEIDWAGALETIYALPGGATQEGLPFLVIDEGQDMPREFYEALVNLGFDRFFVVADQNQQITERNSSREDIRTHLAIESNEVIELKRNYRNNLSVAKLAHAFYTGDPASPPPELPSTSSGTVPVLYAYDQDKLMNVAQGILLLADRDPRQLIGVLTPNNRVRKAYLNALSSTTAKLDIPRASINTFSSTQRPKVAFDEGGILVINAQSCKGLEFDTVILADIDKHFFNPSDPDKTKRLFYVMVARARERVFMFKKQSGRSEIEKILPTDSSILRREQVR